MPTTFRIGITGVLCLLFLACCESVHDLPVIPPSYPSEDASKVIDHRGGTHHRTLVQGRIWYQAYGNELLVLDAHDGSEISRLEPIPFGESGAIVDMVILGKRMYLVSSGDAVIELNLEDQRNPTMRQVRPSAELGIRPRSISVIDGELWISGDGGVIRWNVEEAPRELGDVDSGRIGRVVSTDHGPAAPVGRRVHAVEDGAFLGAASYLEPLSPTAGVEGGMLFILQGETGASVGVMGPDVRQLDDFAMRGTVRGIRFVDGRLWAFSDIEIGTAEIMRGGTLGPVDWIRVKGVRDLGGAGPNYLVVGGTFGRAIYRFRADDAGDGDAFLAVTREPGRLDAAVADGRRVLTGSLEGAWIYTIGDSVELTGQAIDRNVPPSDFAAANWGDARTVEDGSAVVLHLEGVDHEWRAPNDVKVNTMMVMGRRLWIGHDEGLSLLRINGPEDASERDYFDLPPPAPFDEAGHIRISSGVSHLLPVRVGDEVVWVSPNGGIGVAKVERQRLEEWAPKVPVE